MNKTSQKGIDLIKRYEGLRLTAYKCPAGVLTIGYGHTRTVTPGMTINKEMAELLLKEDLISVENAIKRHVKVQLTQNQFDALASLIFNIGEYAFANSTLLKKINEGKYQEAANEFLKWTKVRQSGGFKESPGLVKRRKEERELFLSNNQ